MTVFLIVVAPTKAWQATIPLFNYPPALNAQPPQPCWTRSCRTCSYRLTRATCPAYCSIGVVSGWLLGGITGLVRRDQRAEPLTLLEAIEMRRGRRRWFARNDDATRAALLAGLICGGLIALHLAADASATTLSWRPMRPDQAWPFPKCRKCCFGRAAGRPSHRQLSVRLANALSPVSVIAFFVFGALAIIFIKDPPRWFISRWSAATFAGAVVGALFYLPALAPFLRRHRPVAVPGADQPGGRASPEFRCWFHRRRWWRRFYLVPLVAGLVHGAGVDAGGRGARRDLWR